ncbi:transmembrane protein 18-like isoform X1 [Biomphalaria pfeifferi]|uniref:Transmembrane protein 18-like isoform X1 n=1 Tax=Biomphalaria pfeifferi TaxID=112525 RepID=A0AAD8BJM5_BIOPF|nr:transmembrane protein 18-like isoform X1 [Biomphalaria pfeifferi]
MDFIKTTQITGIWSYLETVDWTEPWLTVLLGFHVFTFLVTFSTRNFPMLQAGHFFILLLLVYFAESLNKLAANNWQLFSKQQYFDSRGMFISLVWSVPLLVNTLVIVMLWLLTSSQLMLTSGRLKLQTERKALEQRNKKKD